MWWSTSLIPALRMQTQESRHKLAVILIYRVPGQHIVTDIIGGGGDGKA